jgi:hypothetical protein
MELNRRTLLQSKRWFLTVLKQPISAAIGARSSHPSGEYR